MVEDLFAELRSALQNPPSAALWRQLTALLLRQEGAFKAPALHEYLMSHLARWPKALRRFDESWVSGGALQNPPSAARYCRAWTPSSDTSAPALEALNAGCCEHVEAISLAYWPAAVEHIEVWLIALAEHPRTNALRHLDLWDVACSEEALRALLGSPLAARLRSLGLGANTLSLDTRRGLQLSALPLLEALCLTGNRLDPGHDLEALGLARMPRLRHLELGQCGLGPQQLGRLFARPPEPLRALLMPRNQLSDAGLSRLLESSLPEQLEALDLGDNQLADAGVARLAQAGARFGALERLDLESNALGDSGALALAQSEGFGALKTLRLADNPQISEGAKAALMRRFGPSVVCLELASAQLKPRGLDGLAFADYD